MLGRDQESDGLCRHATIDRITDAQRSAVHNIIINVRWKEGTGAGRRVEVMGEMYERREDHDDREIGWDERRKQWP